MTAELPPQWEKLKILSTVVATLAVPVVLSIVANSFSNFQKEKELGVRYVELAAQILQSEPNSETKALRAWAISVIDYYSPVALTNEARSELEFQRLKTEIQKQAGLQQALSNFYEAIKSARK
jgi:heme/copper-type cytochrome/quinol oxidase subunit 1